jgi:beta-N-acetylhexosaminidase
VALHCNGVMAEMEQVAAAAPALAEAALRRFRAALQVLDRRDGYDSVKAEAQLALVLGAGRRHTESV